MKKHWIRNLLALLVIAALLAPAAAVAEEFALDGAAAGEEPNLDVEFELLGGDDGATVLGGTGEVSLSDIASPGALGEPEGEISQIGAEPGSKKTVFKGSGKAPYETDSGVISLSRTNITLPAGYYTTVTMTYNGSGDAEFYWSSSNEDIAYAQWTQEWSGRSTGIHIIGKSKGVAYITISTNVSSDTGVIKVTVTDEDEDEDEDVSLSVSPTSLTLKAGEEKSAVVTYTGSNKVSCKSANTGIATCGFRGGFSGDDINLYVTGVKKGSTKITIGCTEGNTVTLKVTVKAAAAKKYTGKGKKDGKQTCRALLIGEEAFNPICTRNRGDVTLMNKILKKVKGPKGKAWTITRKYNLSNTGVKDAIYAAFKKADEDDISLFFIATHGDTDSTGSEAGALAMIPSGLLTMGELATALKAVPGKVIIFVESCGAGAGVYSTDAEQNGASLMKAMKRAAETQDAAVVNAFKAVDSNIEECVLSDSACKGEAVANTGELRVKNKFYVLAAARYHESSFGTEQGPYNYFTKWLTEGVGTSGRMPADTNKDGYATLKELFKYVSKVGDNYAFETSDGVYYQHVQIYPKNSTFKVFKR